MLKQSPSRNQRSKGVKQKYPLNILFLLIIFLWIIYQVKQFSDENNSKKENSTKMFAKGLNEDGFFRFGRKAIMNNLFDKRAEFDRHEEGDEKEVEDNKLNEGSGEEDVDSIEQDKAEETDHEQLEDLIDEDDKEE
ncbi:hypothetical protein Leryth_012904 [Lithospermum erythrorhizon]|uniref:Uncharacterized protein n=1 Tax=Lithospermum erythrorhizon TaxID=34254 RepID=A0AAV3NN35_LITER|nr:hypothetical protein Leryth_012904 [Lithospermum erythrorhizon]